VFQWKCFHGNFNRITVTVSTTAVLGRRCFGHEPERSVWSTDLQVSDSPPPQPLVFPPHLFSQPQFRVQVWVLWYYLRLSHQTYFLNCPFSFRYSGTPLFRPISHRNNLLATQTFPEYHQKGTHDNRYSLWFWFGPNSMRQFQFVIDSEKVRWLWFHCESKLFCFWLLYFIS
jgi:hypothetical protein